MTRRLATGDSTVMTRRLVVLTVLAIVVLTGGLALFLFWTGTLLNRVAGKLEDSADLVRKIDEHAKVIGPGVEHINRTSGVVAGALPLLYGMAEKIVAGLSRQPEQPSGAGHAPAAPEPTRPASGTRRSPMHQAVGFTQRPG